MKLKKRNLLSIVLALGLVLGMMLAMTVTAHAEGQTVVWEGEKAISETSSVHIDKDKFANIQLGDRLVVQFKDAVGDPMELHSNGKMLPGTRYADFIFPDESTREVYATQAMIGSLKEYGLDVSGQGYTVLKVWYEEGRDSVDEDTVWCGDFWIDSWNTLELAATSFNDVNWNEVKAIRFISEADRENWTLNVMTAWGEGGKVADQSSMTWKDNYFELSLDEIDMAAKLEDTDRLMIQGNKDEGEAFNFTQVQLVVVPHVHDFTSYEADGATIKATCTAEDCTLPPSTQGGSDHVATLTITAPEDLIYDENAKEAGITDTNKIQGDAKVVYYNATRSGDTYTKTGDALGAAPVEEGDYVAEITLGVENGSHATAAVGFTIVKEYPLWVDGVKVTSENMSDVLGDADEGATVKFTPATTGEQPTPATLTLNGANITKGYENMGANIGIFYESDDGLNIVLADGSVNKVVAADPSAFTTAISVDKEGEGNVTFSGKGKLVAEGVYQAIHASEDLTIEDCTLDVNATNIEDDGSNAICATDGDVLIKSGDIKASALTSIYGNSVTIDGGTVVAAGDETNGCGIYADEEGSGILSGLVTINSGNVKATGGSEAIHGTVKNAVAGIGWDNTEGTGNGTPIEASSDGQELEFMKVQFPGTSPVEEVTKLIRALPAFNKVRADDEEKILAARAAYEALTDAQKKLVKLSAVRKLKNAETALAGAKKAELRKKKREIAEELADENYVFVREKRAEDAIKAKNDIKEKLDPVKTRSREIQAVLDDIDKSARTVAAKTKDAASKITSTTKRLIKQALDIITRRIKR